MKNQNAGVRFEREYGLVPNRSNPVWEMFTVTFERSGDKLVRLGRTYQMLDVSNPRGQGYDGPVWRCVCVSVVELPWWPPGWTTLSGIDWESEEARRCHILWSRYHVHVDEAKATTMSVPWHNVDGQPCD